MRCRSRRIGRRSRWKSCWPGTFWPSACMRPPCSQSQTSSRKDVRRSRSLHRPPAHTALPCIGYCARWQASACSRRAPMAGSSSRRSATLCAATVRIQSATRRCSNARCRSGRPGDMSSTRCAPAGPPYRVHNATIWAYLADNAQAGADFNRFMTAQSRLHNAAIIEAYDFSEIGTLVDVGGGHGATLAAALAQSPNTRGVLFDLPEVVAPASALETSRFADQCHVVGGDMLQSVPPGGDAYLFKRVMMDLTDDETITVLRNCRSVMKPEGKVLVIDPMLPDGIEPHANRLVDMLMLVTTGGQCRTQAQFRPLFDASGFRLERVIATRSANFILEGVPDFAAA